MAESLRIGMGWEGIPMPESTKTRESFHVRVLTDRRQLISYFAQ